MGGRGTAEGGRRHEPGSSTLLEAPRTSQRVRGARPAPDRRASPVGAASSSCAARRASARARCSDYLSDRVDGWHVATAVGRRVGDGAGLQRPPPALRADARSPRSAARCRSATRSATVFGLSAGARARPLPGRPGHADAVRRGRRAAAARLHRRRRAVARPRVGADPRLRRPPPARRADRDRVRGADGQRRRRPRRAARAGRPRARRRRRAGAAAGATCTARWTRRSATRSSPRATATRSRCSSCRAPGTPSELAGGFGLPGSQPVAGKIEQSYAQRLLQLPSDTRLLVLAAAAEPLGDPVLLHRAAETLGHRHGGSRSGGGRRAAQGRRARRVRAPARPIRRLPLGDRPRTATACIAPSPRPPTPTIDPGPARLAPRPRHAADRARRSPTSSSARPSRAQARGGLAAAAAFLQRAVALTDDPARRGERALAAAQASLQAGAFDAALGLLATAEAGAARRVPAGPGRPGAGPGRVRLGLRQRRPAAAADRRPAARAVRPGSRARDLPGGVGRGRDGRVRSPDRASSWRSAAPSRRSLRRVVPRVRSTCCSTASRC